jgi:hypothetical protein
VSLSLDVEKRDPHYPPPGSIAALNAVLHASDEHPSQKAATNANAAILHRMLESLSRPSRGSGQAKHGITGRLEQLQGSLKQEAKRAALNLAATSIQGMWRGKLARSRSQALRCDRDRRAQAALCLQAGLRGHVARQWFDGQRRHLRCEAAASTVQACWRGRTARCGLEGARTEYEHRRRTWAATAIQAAWHGMRTRWWHAVACARLEQHGAAVAIQAAYHGYRARTWRRLSQCDLRHQAALTIQAACHGFHARSRGSRLTSHLTHHGVALAMSTALNGTPLRRMALPTHATRAAQGRLLQSIGASTGEGASGFARFGWVIVHGAAVVIQSFGRGRAGKQPPSYALPDGKSKCPILPTYIALDSPPLPSLIGRTCARSHSTAPIPGKAGCARADAGALAATETDNASS